jgi:DNA-binding transcriptional ArsR family regulator
VTRSVEALDAVFSALADPTRRAIVERLARRDASVSELAAPFSMSLPAISKHLGVLEDAGLVFREKQGRTRYCRLVPGPMREAAGWLELYRGFWEERLDSLARYLGEPGQAGKEKNRWQLRARTLRSSSAEASARPARKSSPRSPVPKR